MRKFLVALGVATATIAMAAPASAATFFLNINPTIDSQFFGNSSSTKGSISDVFSFTVPQGIVSTFVGSIALSSSLDVVLSKVTFDGTPISKISTGVQELWTLNDTPISAGTHSLAVTGSWGKKGGSYAGTVNFAAVPEPAAWAMMIAGFGFVGASMRRRSKATLNYA